MAPKDVDDILTALADPTRRAVVDLLKTRPHRAGEIAARFGLTPPGMSRHLKVLRTCGIVEDERSETDARVRVFRLRREPIRRLRDWLVEVESFWVDQLGAFKARAERTRGRRKR